jgi:hypothetical protein
MFTLALALNSQLCLIPLGAAHDANAFNVLDGKGFDLLPWVAQQT